MASLSSTDMLMFIHLCIILSLLVFRHSPKCYLQEQMVVDTILPLQLYLVPALASTDCGAN